MNKKIIFCFLILFFNAAVVFSFTVSKTDSIKTLNYDSSLVGLQLCRPGYVAAFYNQTLGNLGSAFRYGYIWERETDLFNLGTDQFRIYEYAEEMNNNFPKNPIFSELKYINGSKKEQNFSIHHFQRLSRFAGFGLNFRSAHSDGFYSKQKADLRNFNIYTFYNSPDKKYNVLFNFLSNRVNSQENGGLRDENSFENAASFDSKVVAVNLQNAQNTQKSKVFYVSQEYNFLKTKADSVVKKDTLQPKLSLKHSFKYEERSVLFTSDATDRDFFATSNYDTTFTYDSLHVKNLINRVSFNIENLAAVNNFLKGNTLFYVAVNHQLFNFNQRELDTTLTTLAFEPGLKIDWNNGLGLNFSFKRDFNNLPFEYYNAFAELSFLQTNKNRGIRFLAEQGRKDADFIYSYYNSNHFIWKNRFAPLDVTHGGLSAEAKFLKQSLHLSFDYYRIKNLAYFNYDALPEQFAGTVNVVSFTVHHAISWKKFNLIDDVKIQHADKGVVRLPLVATYTSFFYENNYFNRALPAQVGVDVRYCTKYFADSYMPATGQFYLQNEKEIGNYPYVDLFANLRIQRFKFFFKLEHLNAGFLKRTYYTVPGYPMAGRTFKFGITWTFFD